MALRLGQADGGGAHLEFPQRKVEVGFAGDEGTAAQVHRHCFAAVELEQQRESVVVGSEVSHGERHRHRLPGLQREEEERSEWRWRWR